MTFTFRIERWPLETPFVTSNAVYETSDVVVAEVSRDGHVGRGEACGVDYLGETVESISAQLAELCSLDIVGLGRSGLRSTLAPGGARNALDCALWDLECKMAGVRAWTLAGLADFAPRRSFVTLSKDSPEAMTRAAAALGQSALIKLKLGDDEDIERVDAIRAVAPDARLIVDANSGWSLGQLLERAPHLSRAGVELIEQPLEAGSDQHLAAYSGEVPLCADESCQGLDTLEDLAVHYRCVNVKLDKTGGLTEALEMVQRAKALGLRVMVGCMSATSLGIAPAAIVAQHADVVDLDWHLFNREDRAWGFDRSAPVLARFDERLWG